MADDRAQLENTIAALKAALRRQSNVAEVQIDGVRTRYASLEEIQSAIDRLEARVQRESGARPRVMSINLGGVW